MPETERSRLVEAATGAQILPPVRAAWNERATIPAYVAHLACDADLRATDKHYMAVAARLTVTKQTTTPFRIGAGKRVVLIPKASLERQ